MACYLVFPIGPNRRVRETILIDPRTKVDLTDRTMPAADALPPITTAELHARTADPCIGEVVRWLLRLCPDLVSIRLVIPASQVDELRPRLADILTAAGMRIYPITAPTPLGQRHGCWYRVIPL